MLLVEGIPSALQQGDLIASGYLARRHCDVRVLGQECACLQFPDSPEWPASTLRTCPGVKRIFECCSLTECDCIIEYCKIVLDVLLPCSLFSDLLYSGCRVHSSRRVLRAHLPKLAALADSTPQCASAALTVERARVWGHLCSHLQCHGHINDDLLLCGL